jgi:RNA recognition motif-containing protein
MTRKVYVGNLNYDTTEATLQELFEAHGEVATVNVVTDRASGRSRGFAFVEMENDEGADAAIAALNGQEVDGWALKVAPAKPRNRD